MLRYIIRALDYFELSAEEHAEKDIDKVLAERFDVDKYPVIFVSDIPKLKKHFKTALEELEELEAKHKNTTEEYIYLGEEEEENEE